MNGKSALRGFNVLVVEDDADTQEAVRRILEGEGAAVVTAASAPEGLQAFLNAVPDVLVCDLGLPGADGYALIRQIRELPTRSGDGPSTCSGRPELQSRDESRIPETIVSSAPMIARRPACFAALWKRGAP